MLTNIFRHLPTRCIVNGSKTTDSLDKLSTSRNAARGITCCHTTYNIYNSSRKTGHRCSQKVQWRHRVYWFSGHPSSCPSVSRHFGPKTFRHHQTGGKVSGQFGTTVEMSRHWYRTVSTSSKHVLLQQAVKKKGFILLIIIIKEDHGFYSYTQEYTADD